MTHKRLLILTVLAVMLTLVLVLPTLAAPAAAPGAAPVTCNSTGSGSWYDTTKWSCGLVPGTNNNNDSANINLGHTMTLTGTNGIVGDVTITGTLSLAGFNFN